MTYFAAALALCDQGWTGRELDLDGLTDVDVLADELRDLTGDGPGPALLLLEEDDEYVAVVRVDGGVGSLAEPRIFLSDRRAANHSSVAAMLWQEADSAEDEDGDLSAAEDEDEDEGTRPVSEPVGDRELLSDLGTPPEVLIGLCAEEGLLPADVLTMVGERGGFVDVLESLREA